MPRNVKCGWRACRHNDEITGHCRYEGDIELEFSEIQLEKDDKDILECKQFQWKHLTKGGN
jgi:hypothetical protein